jgi:hypothetical protein
MTPLQFDVLATRFTWGFKPLDKTMEHGRGKSYASARIYRQHERLWIGNFTRKLLGGDK